MLLPLNNVLKFKTFSLYVGRLSRQIATTTKLSSEELFVHRDTNDNNSTTPFEFTEPNMTRLTAIIQNYPQGCQRSALGAALDLVQRQIGWVPIGAMHKVAQILSVPRIRVYEWATFYTMVKRRYRGKYHVKVCSTTPCMLRGAECILSAAEEACCCTVGNTSPDGMFGIDIVECQGACANAPVLVVDDDYYEDVTICDVHNIIKTIKGGYIPPAGPQNGRYSCEPCGGETTLCCPPPGPGFCLQQSLWSAADLAATTMPCVPKLTRRPVSDYPNDLAYDIQAIPTSAKDHLAVKVIRSKP